MTITSLLGKCKLNRSVVWPVLAFGKWCLAAVAQLDWHCSTLWVSLYYFALCSRRVVSISPCCIAGCLTLFWLQPVARKYARSSAKQREHWTAQLLYAFRCSPVITRIRHSSFVYFHMSKRSVATLVIRCTILPTYGSLKSENRQFSLPALI